MLLKFFLTIKSINEKNYMKSLGSAINEYEKAIGGINATNYKADMIQAFREETRDRNANDSKAVFKEALDALEAEIVEAEEKARHFLKNSAKSEH